MTSELSEAGMAPWPLIQHFFFYRKGPCILCSRKGYTVYIYDFLKFSGAGLYYTLNHTKQEDIRVWNKKNVFTTHVDCKH